MSTEKKISFFAKIVKYLKESKSELKKIVWPGKKQIINNSTIVIVGIIIAGLVIAGIDYLFTGVIGWSINLFAK